MGSFGCIESLADLPGETKLIRSEKRTAAVKGPGITANSSGGGRILLHRI
jgi:hypothetical protein